MDLSSIKNDLRQAALARGGVLFGVCQLADLDAMRVHREIIRTVANLPRAISVGVPLSKAVLDTLTDGPNMLYKAHYRHVNRVLDDIAFLISRKINDRGGKSIPIPASQILRWKPMRAHLSHREVAFRAGLGWWGRNNLLVNDTYGSQVRLVTILTNLELEPDRASESDCGDCYRCLDSCPAGAIAPAKERFNLMVCAKQVAEFARPEMIGSHICGLCLKPCGGQR
jgi:epoxyqueuosine reductase